MASGIKVPEHTSPPFRSNQRVYESWAKIKCFWVRECMCEGPPVVRRKVMEDRWRLGQSGGIGLRGGRVRQYKAFCVRV
eukprot:1195645-Prorocentrum_minimum.AAC.4